MNLADEIIGKDIIIFKWLRAVDRDHQGRMNRLHLYMDYLAI